MNRLAEMAREGKPDHYAVNGWCSNCRWQGVVEVPKGEPVPIVSKRPFSGKECPSCGCLTAFAWTDEAGTF